MVMQDVRRDKAVHRQRRYRSVGINHETVLVERGVDTNDVLDLVINLKLQRIHGGIEVSKEPKRE